MSSSCPHPEQLAGLASGDCSSAVPADVAAHVATCLPCRAIVADQRSIAELARRTLPTPTLSRTHRDRIAAEVMARSDDLPAPSRSWSPGVALTAIAAALVVGIAIAALVSASLGRRTPDRSIARTPDGSRTPDKHPPGPRTPDNQAPDNQTPDNRTADNQPPDNRTADNQPPDNRTPDSRTPDSRTPDSRTPDSRTPDNRTADNRTADNRTPDNRTPDKNLGRTAVARVEGGGGQLAREAGQTSDRVQVDDGAVTIDARGARPVEIATPGTRVRIGDAKVSVLAKQGVIETVTVIAGTVEVTSRGQKQVIETGTIWERDHAVDAAFEAFRDGWTALRAGRYADAIAAFDRAVDPAVAEDAQYWAAVASERAGQDAEARRRFGEFLARFPTSPRADAARAALARLPL